MISFQKIYGLYGLKHHSMEISGDVTMETNKQTKSENRASQPFDTRAAGLLTFATSGCFCLVCTVFWDSAANVLLIVFNNYCFNLIFQPQPPRKVLIRVIFKKNWTLKSQTWSLCTSLVPSPPPRTKASWDTNSSWCRWCAIVIHWSKMFTIQWI